MDRRLDYSIRILIFGLVSLFWEWHLGMFEAALISSLDPIIIAFIAFFGSFLLYRKNPLIDEEPDYLFIYIFEALIIASIIALEAFNHRDHIASTNATMQVLGFFILQGVYDGYIRKSIVRKLKKSCTSSHK